MLQNLQYGSPTTSEHSYQKNPFDFFFEQARKQNINHRYAPNLATNLATSPLNTPSISLNEGAAPWIPLPLTTPMVVTSSIEVEPEPPLLQKTASLEETGSTLNGCSSKANNNSNGSQQRSNVVSVICPPSAKATDPSGSNFNEGSARSAPVLTTDASAEVQTTPSMPRSAPSELTCLRSYPRKNKPPLLAPITLPFVPLPNEEEPSLASTAQAASLPSTDTPRPTTVQISNPESGNRSQPPSIKSLSSLVRIVPKPRPAVESSVAKQLNISSLPPRRKEKTEEELLSRLKATEAALPPKAKPGRKSRTAAEEDANQKKRRSLERNRAAAMRCRLKVFCVLQISQF